MPGSLSSITRLIVSCGLLIGALGGCSSSVPRLHQPDRIDAFCADRAAIVTAIESIVASTGDAGAATAPPTGARIHQIIERSGGVIAHWRSQPLYQPSVAKALGITGDYVTIGDAAIVNGATSGDSRPLYLTVKASTGDRTFALRAYDVQDVCNAGKLSS